MPGGSSAAPIADRNGHNPNNDKARNAGLVLRGQSGSEHAAITRR